MVRQLATFASHEIASDEFRDTLVMTVEALTKLVQQQAQEIQGLKAEVAQLKTREKREAVAQEGEWKAFQWLFEAAPSDDESKEATGGKKRRRQEEEDDEGEDTDELSDSAISGALAAGPPPKAKKAKKKEESRPSSRQGPSPVKEA
mmetsp:Transcript_10825/g.25941  ORF Transcript_10825/g.25941 Transcript_10825/m.25941 type:complete len:147 (+) Transcript_10825:53-493(+)